MKTLSEKYAFMYGELSINAEVFSSLVIDYLESDNAADTRLLLEEYVLQQAKRMKSLLKEQKDRK